MNMKKIAASLAPTLLVLGIAAVAFAIPITEQKVPTGPTNLQELLNTLDNVINLVFTALIVISIIFIILAAFQFVTAGGDPNGVIMARQKLIWAAVGIIVALLSKSVPVVLKAVLGVT